jgi:hypothetical protein
MIRQPLFNFAGRRNLQVREQLRQISLWIDVVSAAGAGDATEDTLAIAAHESPRTTKLYDRTTDAITFVDRVIMAKDQPELSPQNGK